MSRRPKITQDIVMDYLVGFISENGYSPSVREIQLGLDIDAPSTVQRRLRQLEDAGRISRHRFKSRTIRVVND